MTGNGRSSDSDENWVWENYWQGDRVALCLDTDYIQYDESVSTEWKAYFSEFEDGSSLLDICTGNGAVAILAVQSSKEEGKSFDVTGVDRADIDPARFVSSNLEILEEITFKGGIDVAELPWSDASFDSISGQYALEYTDTSRSLPEIARVLKPKGRARFLLHAAEGTTVESSLPELKRIETFQATSNVFDAAKRAIDAAIKLKKVPSPGKSIRQRAAQSEVRFQSALEACADQWQKSDRDFIYGTVSRLSNALQAVQYYEEQEIRSQFEKIRASLDAHEGRLRALVRSAVSFDACQAITENLKSLGLQPDPVLPAVINIGQIGWIISATKP